MSDGWIKLHRRVLQHPVYVNDPTAWRVFEALLLLADRHGEWKGGVDQLASYIRENRNTVYSTSLRLERHGMVKRLSNKRYTVYQICNWDRWQVSSSNEIQIDVKQTSNELQDSYKKEKKNKNTSSLRSLVRPVDDQKSTAHIEQTIADWQAKYPAIDVPYEWERCKNYFEAKGKQIKSWPAAFRNWLTSEIPKKARPRPKWQPPQTQQEVNEEGRKKFLAMKDQILGGKP